MRRQLCDEHVAVENQAAHLEDAMLRRLSKRRLTRLEADIRLLDRRLAEMVATNAAFARLHQVRAGHQPQDRQGTRPRRAANAARARRRGHRDPPPLKWSDLNY